ncbi:NAD(P)-binding domain-containing protein [Helicobacter pylori]
MKIGWIGLGAMGTPMAARPKCKSFILKQKNPV